jgi:hypothetical protein
MSVFYPRTIEIHRSKTNAVSSGGAQQVGLTGYSGREQSTAPSDAEGETVLFSGIPAAIDAKSPGRTRGTFLPADITEKGTWIITIPAASLPQYSVRDRDIIVDDEGYRYGVGQNYWTVTGYQLACIRLET